MPESNEKKDNNIFEITTDDYDLYQMFDKLYNSLINYIAFDNRVDESFKRYDKNSEYPLVKDNIITWISDEDPDEIASRVSIYKEQNKIILHFFDGIHQNGFVSKAIRFSTSGSRYNYFYIPFMELYNNICEHDFSFHQYSIDEYLLSLKKK
jgi:hypothetical protein